MLLKKIKNKRLRRKIIELIKRKLKQRKIKTRNRNKIFRLIQLLINSLRPGSFGGFDYLLSSSYYDYSSFGGFSSDELYNIDYGSWRYLQTFIEKPDVNNVFVDVVNDIDIITINNDIDISIID